MNVLRKLNRPVSATHASLSYVIRSKCETLVHSSGSTSPISTRIFNAGSLDHAASDFGLLGRYRPPNQHPLPQDRRRLLDLHCSGASKCSSRDAAYSSPDNGADGPPTSAPAIPPVIAPAAAPFSSASAGLETDNSVQRKANRISAIDMATLLHFV